MNILYLSGGRVRAFSASESPVLPSSRSIFGARDERRTDVLTARTVAFRARETTLYGY